MYNKLNGDCGVLSDYDLAHLYGQQRSSDTECTGTVPFMTLDLLSKDAMDGNITRLYRQDCESFVWVLLWICLRRWQSDQERALERTQYRRLPQVICDKVWHAFLSKPRANNIIQTFLARRIRTPFVSSLSNLDPRPDVIILNGNCTV
jgi:Fungal protein kinase